MWGRQVFTWVFSCHKWNEEVENGTSQWNKVRVVVRRVRCNLWSKIPSFSLEKRNEGKREREREWVKGSFAPSSWPKRLIEWRKQEQGMKNARNERKSRNWARERKKKRKRKTRVEVNCYITNFDMEMNGEKTLSRVTDCDFSVTSSDDVFPREREVVFSFLLHFSSTRYHIASFNLEQIRERIWEMDVR